MGLAEDIRTVSGVASAHRGWLDRHEIELLHSFGSQVRSGWCLSLGQRKLIDAMARRAEERRDVAMSLSEAVN